jgi:hypothetical protein
MITSYLVSRGWKGLAARTLAMLGALAVSSALVQEFLATRLPHGP